MKSTKEYFPVIMLITLYKVALTFESVDKILGVTIQMKATKQYFLEALFISMYFIVVPFISCTRLSLRLSLDETLKYNFSNESDWATLCCGAVYYAVQRLS